MITKKLLDWSCQVEADYEGGAHSEAKTLHPVIAEIVGARLMHALGIGSASTVEIISAAEAQKRDEHTWVFKSIPRWATDRSRAVKLAWLARRCRYVLAVAKIPNAITIAWLRLHYGIVGSGCLVGAPEGAAPAHKKLWGGIRRILFFGKVFEGEAEFYRDFQPPKDWVAVRHAIAWDSHSMLRVHAARLFMATTAAHAGNVLVDPDGRIYSIDHECTYKTSGDDLRFLFDSVAPRTRAFEALRPVAQLRDGQVRVLFSGLPRMKFPWPLDSQEATVQHYLDRLHLWRELFQQKAQ